MATPENIEAFNEITGRIFADLYANFPVPIAINAFQAANMDFSQWTIPPRFHEEAKTFHRTELSEAPNSLKDYEYTDLVALLSWQDQNVLDAARSALLFVVHTCSWLAETGYITAEINTNNTDPYIDNVVLTAKGLEALSAMPSSISGEKPLGEKLIDQAKKGGKSVLGETVKQVLAVGIGLGAHHFGLTP